ncbi:uncharacterized protein LOC118646411 [Monomorium pharaonis]|uniref:uncharacterized protein LOC118646411 n=1 Tax=Monomorium pharaonis TaxID=307658 RepID=UPI001747A129|nr:uncharacterized protein LOC118646411 [Monomorium pharaonis]
MLQFNPYNVIFLLAITFNGLDYPNTPITSQERRVNEKIEHMLLEIKNEEQFQLEEEETLDFYDEYEVPEAEKVDLLEADEEKIYFPEEVICDSVEKTISNDYKRQAVEYWKSGKTKPRSLEGVKQKFRQVTSIRQLRRWENYFIQGGSRPEKLKKISQYTLDHFNEALERKIIIHDIDIARWASQAQNEENVAGFKASEKWVQRFKKAHNIVSRKITKFVTKKSLLSKPDLENKCETFIANVKYYINRFGVENIYNSDQSGFQLEFHSGRTLAQKGIKNVESTVQSISATTHSYTIQPTISADGRLLSPLFIVLKEITGTFGPRVQEILFNAPNIFVTASKSGKLTSNHVKTWLKEVFFPNVGPQSVLLLDSWSGHCPNIVSETKPDSATDIVFLTIPAGTTGKIQPLDVYGFRLWKNFIKYFSDTIMLLNLALDLHNRNNILKLQSLTHHQFSSPRFQNIFKYAWTKSGYVENAYDEYLQVIPIEFETPVDFCFKKNSKVKCDLCDEIAIITCSWCRKSLCITHFFHEHHLCNEYVP